MSITGAAAQRLASDIVALTALPGRWVGASAERVADDVACTLYHLCDELERVYVRLELPPATQATAVCPPQLDPPARFGDAPDLVRAENEAVLPIGHFGRHGEIAFVAKPGTDTSRARLLALIAANEVEAACRALDLERDVAQAHAKVAALGKLGALGQLVGGVAHELRTPLTYASNNLFLIEQDILKRYPDAAESVRPKLAEISGALDRINAIVRQLRRFARQEATLAIEEDLRDLVRDALRLWRATHVSATTIRERLAPTAPINADRGQLQQVVLNLVQNAQEAILESGGVITVETRDEGTHALLVVTDDGPGMTPEIQRTLFQPFLTTKRDGLGLGLSIVRGIIEAHRGSIEIVSAPGKGTRVLVRIPRAAPEGEAGA